MKERCSDMATMTKTRHNKHQIQKQQGTCGSPILAEEGMVPRRGTRRSLPPLSPERFLRTFSQEDGGGPKVTFKPMSWPIARVKLAPRARATSQYSPSRSEERRVGKESLRLCRSRWSPYH